MILENLIEALIEVPYSTYKHKQLIKSKTLINPMKFILFILFIFHRVSQIFLKTKWWFNHI